jgi:hypothetical protein
MSNILNVKIICLVWFLLFRKVQFLREVAGGMLGLSGKEETVRINHLPKKSTLSDANKCRKEFLKKFYNNCSNIALFYRTVEFR